MNLQSHYDLKMAQAAASGCFETGFGRYPRLQIFTIRELLAGMKPELPPLGRAEGFRRGPQPEQKIAL